MAPILPRIARRRTGAALAALALCAASLPAWAIKPFTADYQASYMGMQGNGRMTLGALEAARARGVRIGPGGMGIAAYDDDPFFSLLTPSITAIAQPTAELGGAAMRTLLELIQGGEPARTHSLPARLIVRESTTTP